MANMTKKEYNDVTKKMAPIELSTPIYKAARKAAIDYGRPTIKGMVELAITNLAEQGGYLESVPGNG